MDRSITEETRKCLDECWDILRSLGAVPDGADRHAAFFENNGTDTPGRIRELLREGWRELADCCAGRPELTADHAEALRALARLDPTP